MKKSTLILFLSQIIFSCGFALEKSDSLFFKTDNKIIYDICFTKNGGALGIADNNSIKVYSTNSKVLLNEFKNGHKGRILSIDISKDSTLLVSGGKDSTIVLWDFINNKIIKSLSFEKGIVTSVKISPDQKYLAAGGTDHKVYLYDLEKNEVIREFDDHTDDVTSVKFSPNGNLLATASGDKTIDIYDLNTYKIIDTLKGHKDWVRDISFSYDGTKLVSCGDDSRVILWNLMDTQHIRMIYESKVALCWILSVDFNEDNKTYVWGNLKGTAEIYELFGNYVAKIHRPINRVIFKPNEGYYIKIAVATRGKGVMMFKGKNFKVKNPLL